jgi:hypothetical protein
MKVKRMKRRKFEAIIVMSVFWRLRDLFVCESKISDIIMP